MALNLAKWFQIEALRGAQHMDIKINTLTNSMLLEVAKMSLRLGLACDSELLMDGWQVKNIIAKRMDYLMILKKSTIVGPSQDSEFEKSPKISTLFDAL